MQMIANFAQASAFLSQYVRAVNEPGGYKLDRITAVMEFLGNPQDTYKVIHVAGTSGKTSTCYYVASMLHAAGCKVGHTVSPHVDTISERAQINLQILPEAEYCAKLSQFLDCIEPSNIELSYFEILVAFAYWLFAEEKVEYAVVEVGLGGLLDGTNVIHRSEKVCVITDIGFDHVEILGKTLPEITRQKAGIIHAENPVFMYRQSGEVVTVIQETCQSVNAELHIISPVASSDLTSGLPLFQQRNWYLASVVTTYVLNRDGRDTPTEQEWVDTIQTHIPARMETVVYKDKIIVLDGSHNEQKIGALVESMRLRYPDTNIQLLVSFGENKSSSLAAAMRKLRELSDSIIITEFARGQDEIRTSLGTKEMMTVAQQAGFTTVVEKPKPVDALNYSLEQPSDVLLVTGSFYLLNYVRPALFASA